ncbi:hypothetical protein M9Y10_030038 [Tritrichomonas musculus]|uniref:Surface antigen BspA-like protein n=1 Tax=Tritrichomonas musculus TaxID=1915356 RepID=A0ABR2KNV2_9EUKA
MNKIQHLETETEKNKVKYNNIIFSLNEKEKTASVIGYLSNHYDIFIPQSIKNNDQEYIITSINESSFECSYISSIKFPPNSELQKIERDAFKHTKIESISIPSHVSKLEDGWCSFMPELTKVTIMPGNQYFKHHEDNDNLIIGRTNLKSDKYENLLFVNREIKTVTIPSFIKKIASNAFSYSLIEKVSIPSQVIQIDEFAFFWCSQLKTVEIPNDSDLQKIGKLAFACSSIERFFIPQQVKTICEASFTHCYHLKTVEIPLNSELQKIERFTFSHTKIECISIPKNVIELEEGWCGGTPKLKKVTIMSDNQRYKNYGDKLVIGKTDPKSDIFDVLVFVSRDIEAVTIPSFIKRIASHAFSGTSIKDIVIPPSVEEIGEGSFCECKQLRFVEIHKDSKLRIIEKEAFKSSTLEKISLPSHITQIYEETFSECGKLKKVEISPDSELQVIGNKAFNNSSIVSIFIPCHVKTIGKAAFNSCNNLSHIHFQENSELQIIEQQAFHLSSIESVFIPSTVRRICEGAFACCENLQRVQIQSNSELLVIEKEAFIETLFESFLIPCHVTEIGEDVFHDCDNLQIIEIDENSDLKMTELIEYNDNTDIIIMIPTKMRKFFQK